MARRDKRKRDAQPAATGAAAANPTPDSAAEVPGETSEQRRARQKREWEEEKRRKEMKGKVALPIIGTTTVGALVGGITSLVVVVGAIAGVFLLVSGGDSDSEPQVSATPDPRVQGEPVASTVDVSAADSGVNVAARFDPNVVTGRSGEVIEIKITNDGSSAHNIAVTGLDKEYDTRDDFRSETLEPGESGSVLVKIDEAGTYPFRCDFHPQAQVGQLILS